MATREGGSALQRRSKAGPAHRDPRLRINRKERLLPKCCDIPQDILGLRADQQSVLVIAHKAAVRASSSSWGSGSDGKMIGRARTNFGRERKRVRGRGGLCGWCVGFGKHVSHDGMKASEGVTGREESIPRVE